MLIEKTRRLPIKGELLVSEGDLVQPDTLVARTDLPGDPETVNVTNYLGTEAEDTRHFMLKTEGERVKKGETLARTSMFFGLIKRDVRSPIDGTVEMISEVTGGVTLRGESIPVELNAYISGRVTELLPEEGVVIQTMGAMIQGIFGVGGERHGQIKCLAKGPSDLIGADAVDESCRGSVIVAGRLVTGEVLAKAAEVGASGVIGGGIIDVDLVEFLGHDIGVAITGQEDIPLTLVLTEGFGEIDMAQRTFDLLHNLDGEMAVINGATQIRAGVLRPEIIVPGEGEGSAESEGGVSAGLIPGTPIRIIREPWFGELAEVVELPPDLQEIESEARVRVLKAKLESGDIVVVPRANVEIIEG